MPNKLIISTATNPSLITIKPDYAGNKVLNGRFLNYQKVSVPSVRDILNWRFRRDKTYLKQKENDKFVPQVIEDSRLLSLTVPKIVWLGHASFLITCAGKNILVDPVFADIPLVKRRAAIPFNIENYTSIDYILITHSHYDHLDKTTLIKLAKINPHAKIYCGLNTAKLLRKWKVNNQIVEASWYQRFPLEEDGIEFYFMPSLHWSKRTLNDRNILLWGSFIIRSHEATIYLMGDSGYSPHFKEIGQFFPEIDYAILGIGAYAPRYIMQYSHISPEEARQAYYDLGARYLIPMHYATYNLTDEFYSEPLNKINQLFVEEINKLKIVNIGQVYELSI